MENFTLYASILEALELIKDEVRRNAFLWKICQYGCNGVEPELDDMEAVCFAVIKKDIENNKQYRKQQSEKGRLGGAPKGNQNATKTTKNNQEQPSDNQNQTNKIELNKIELNKIELNEIKSNEIEDGSIFSVDEIVINKINEFSDELKSGIRIDEIANRNGIKKNDALYLLGEFKADQVINRTEYPKYNEFVRHFGNWVKRNLKLLETKDDEVQKLTPPKLHIRGWYFEKPIHKKQLEILVSNDFENAESYGGKREY